MTTTTTPAAGVDAPAAPAPAELTVARKGRRTGAVAACGFIAVFLVVLGVVALQVVLIDAQRGIDSVRRDIEAERLVQDGLRRREVQLRSPAEIRQIATEQLGMVPAETPALVTPTTVVVGYPLGDPRGAGTPTTGTTAPPAASPPTPAPGQ